MYICVYVCKYYVHALYSCIHVCMYVRGLSQVSVLIFLCTNWQCSTSLMYISMLVVTLAACPYVFQLKWLSQSCAAAVCVWSCLLTLLHLRSRKISNNGTLSNFVWNSTNLPQRHLFLLPKFMEMPLYRELSFLSGTKLSKMGEKMLKTTLVLEDQSRRQMIKMWKWCELWWRKTAVSGWLQKKRTWIKVRF